MSHDINLNVVVGTPGTGKSYRLIKKAIDRMKHHKSIYIMTPTNTTKKRLISGFLDEVRKGHITVYEYRKLCGDTHVLQYNYKNEEVIFIDEFSMLDISDWYSLLFMVERETNKKQFDSNIITYGDVKQLPSIKNNGTLGVLLKFNFKKEHKHTSEDYNKYVAVDLYKNITDQDLVPPNDWNNAIKHIHLTALHKNYRLSGKSKDEYGNYITDYDERFYNYIYINNIITAYDDEGYCKFVSGFIDKEYLIIAPTHRIGGIIDKYMADKLSKEELESTAPFLRNGSTVYRNSHCDIDYNYDFIDDLPEDYGKSADNYTYSFYVTVHSCQGATVNNVAFVTMNYKVNPHVKDFYSNNMLYTALSRARNNSYFLGNNTVFQFMRTNYNEITTKPYNYLLQKRAANKTYGNLVQKLKKEIRMTYKDVLKLYANYFTLVLNDDKDVVDTAREIDSKFKPKPFTDDIVMSMLNPDSKNRKVGKHLDDKWYKSEYYRWFNSVKTSRASKGGKIGGSNGGKHSSVKNWLDSLSDNELNKVIDDMYLSRRKFATKYHHDKRSVKILLN